MIIIVKIIEIMTKIMIITAVIVIKTDDKNYYS